MLNEIFFNSTVVSSSEELNIHFRKSRKPDIRIYVPRGRRMLQDNTYPQDQLTEQGETLRSGRRYVKNNSAIKLDTTETWDTETKENEITNCMLNTPPCSQNLCY